MRSPRVSVLMTVYNAEAFLRASVDSVLAQTFQDWELVAVDDGSSDSSLTILRSYDDPRIRVLPMTSNIGRTPALRRATELARGEYLAVLDADDIALPQRLTRQVAALDCDPDIAAVGAWASIIDENGREIGTMQPEPSAGGLCELMASTNPFVHSATTFRAAAVQAVGGYPLEFIYAQDFALILKIAATSRVEMLREVLCLYRESPTAMTASSALRLVRAEEELALLRRAAELLPLSVPAQRRNRNRQAIAELKMGMALLRTRRFPEGMSHVLGVMLRRPLALIETDVVRRRLGAWP